jgi:hypothetical protein
VATAAVTAPTTPASYPLSYWWKASSITGVANGAAVPTWTSVDGSATVFTGAGPTYVASSTFNGQPGVLFNFNKFFGVGSIPANCTICVLAYATLAGSALLGDEGDFNHTLFKYNGGANTISTPFATSNVFATPVGTPVCNWYQRDNIGTLNFFENQTARGSSAAHPALIGFQTIGSVVNFGYWNQGVMTEVVIWNAVLTPAQIADMYVSYFKPLYGNLFV